MNFSEKVVVPKVYFFVIAYLGQNSILPDIRGKISIVTHTGLTGGIGMRHSKKQEKSKRCDLHQHEVNEMLINKGFHIKPKTTGIHPIGGKIRRGQGVGGYK